MLENGRGAQREDIGMQTRHPRRRSEKWILGLGLKGLGISLQKPSGYAELAALALLIKEYWLSSNRLS